MSKEVSKYGKSSQYNGVNENVRRAIFDVSDELVSKAANIATDLRNVGSIDIHINISPDGFPNLSITKNISIPFYFVEEKE